MPALYEQFFLFGDSITQDSFNEQRGFSSVLQAAYIRKLDVVNRGFSGYTTRQALQVLPSIIPSPEVARIRFLTIFFGANDSSLPDAPNKQHVPMEEYKANLEKIITHPLIVAHNPRIILIAPPPINEHLWWPRDKASGYALPSRVAATTKEYANAACEVGSKLKIPVLDLWKAFMEEAKFDFNNWKAGDPVLGSLDIAQNDRLLELMYDGLHFQPAGYDILYREMMQLIAERWPDQMPEKLPSVLPGWSDEVAWKALDDSNATK
ncbi:SGNH hydrolase [Dothidotthia symphoricarpi CBS 119687]|uniref:SGNH hydrolase n=1 Tax=Dothidotthia symphoricarpi CBS 119687 TaxID=1392245 RepID=A0A6A6A5Y7_9PLEO|nr:SGNH hydrolase [Dothidotthia symphoricarpi CBS 119687]KAF2126188.1 SGNH hydrolase [Dothidotthia symphoricarpi CBS 119687]